MSSASTPRTPAWPPKSAPRLFVDQVIEAGAAITLGGSQAHYLAKVMRIKPADAIILCDDVTGEWLCKVSEVAKRSVALEPIERLRPREAVPDFWLCAALLKKDRFDVTLEKATELGAAQIVPIITRRCVADKLNQTRALTIVTEAAEQCARTALPVLEEPQKLGAMLENWPKNRALFFADEIREGTASAEKAFAAQTGPAALLIGPEGGFDDEERALIRAHPQAHAISLGPRILRGETAAIAGMALWMGTRGDWSESVRA